MQRFTGKKVLITAGARTIGLASSLRLLGEGAQVLITDIDANALAEAAQEAKRHGHTLLTECFDLGDPADCNAGVARCIDHLGGAVHVVVNNAGGALHTPYNFSDQSDADWDRVFGLNLMAAVRVLRSVLPLMVKQNYGRVVMLGSKAGRYGSQIAGPNYAAVKGAIHALTRQIAIEYGPHSITCNAVCPGVVVTERTKKVWAERRTAEERERILNEIPLRRNALPEDVANAISFFASDDASFVSGAILDVNGGQAMSG